MKAASVTERIEYHSMAPTFDYKIITDFYIVSSSFPATTGRSRGTPELNIDYGFVVGLSFKFCFTASTVKILSV